MRLIPLVLLLGLTACQSTESLDTFGGVGGKADEASGILGELCPFNDMLVHSIDSGVIEMTFEKTLTRDSVLTPLEEKQIMAFFSRFNSPGSASQAIAEMTDDAELTVSTAVSTVTDHDAMTVYEFSAGDNPMGFIYTMDSMEFVAEIGDGTIMCEVEDEETEATGDGCAITGFIDVAGDWPSFSVWTLGFDRDLLTESFTDDLPADQWRTTLIKDEGGTLYTLVQVTDASDAIITTTLHLRTSNCDPELGPDIEVVGATTTFEDQEGTSIQTHEVALR